MRAERERQGLPAEPAPPAAEPVSEPVPEPERKSGTVQITVEPVLDQAALVAICDQITASVRDAFLRGFAAGLADADAFAEDNPL